jgi:DNA-binding NtrC family response regulator
MEINEFQEIIFYYNLSGSDLEKQQQIWLQNLNDDLKQRGFSIFIKEGKSAWAEAAPYKGHPFIWLGDKQKLLNFLTKLSPITKRLINNHSYYWIVTDSHFSGSELAGIDLYVRPDLIHNWGHKAYQHASEKLEWLFRMPDLKGLSTGLAKVRNAIKKITRGGTGPSYPVLILGETGTGKEVVAKWLFKLSNRNNEGFKPVNCGEFKEDLLQSQLFGHKKGAFTSADTDNEGLLSAKKYTNGTIFLDDFDQMPKEGQGQLLRIMQPESGKPGQFSRLGDFKNDQETNAWLLFSINKNIKELLGAEKLRDDFIYRFGERVIHIPPLRVRIADIPAIAFHIWNEIWPPQSGRRELYPKLLQWLLEECTKRNMKWEGNVRNLRTLLSLTASMAKLEEYNQYTIKVILENILEKGDTYLEWVDVMPDFTDPPMLAMPPSRQGRLKSQEDYQQTAQQYLTEAGRKIFANAIQEAPLTRNSQKTPVNQRLSKIICYLWENKNHQIDKKIAGGLNKVGHVTAEKDLKLLLESGIIKIDRAGAARLITKYGIVQQYFNFKE